MMSATTIFATQRRAPRLRRERFVQEYLADPQRNATAAYLRAGYKASAVSARAGAARLLKQRDVRRAIEAARDTDAGNYDVQRERVIEQLCRLAFSDVRALFREDGTLKEISELDVSTAAALAHYEVHETYLAYESDSARKVESGAIDLEQAVLIRRSIKVRMADKRAALDSLVRVMGYSRQDEEKGAHDTLSGLLKDILAVPSILRPVARPDDHNDDDGI